LRQRFFRENVDLDFERRREDTRDVRLQDDEVADLDRVQELKIVDGRGDQQTSGVPMALYSPTARASR